MSSVSNFKCDLRTLMRMLVRSAMRAFKECKSQYQVSEMTHNEVLYITIAFIVEFVRYLEENPTERQAFLADPYWIGKTQAPKEKNLPRLATMMMIGAKTCHGALYQQALSHSKVVEYYIGSEMNGEEIADDLKHRKIRHILLDLDYADEDGGETRAAQPEAQARSVRLVEARRSSPLADDDDLLAGEDFGGHPAEPADDDDPASIGRAGAQTDPAERATRGRRPAPVRAKPRRYPFKQSEELAINDGGHRDRFFEMDIDDELVVTIRRTANLDGWPKFEITGIGPLA